MDWSAAHYGSFEQQRSRPAIDLLDALPDLSPAAPPGILPAARTLRAIDPGCGPGNATALLRARFPDAMLVGLDGSPDMLEAARRRLPDVAFERADIDDRARMEGEPFDLVSSNAALHWLPATPRCCRRCWNAWRRAARWRCRSPTSWTSRRTF